MKSDQVHLGKKKERVNCYKHNVTSSTPVTGAQTGDYFIPVFTWTSEVQMVLFICVFAWFNWLKSLISFWADFFFIITQMNVFYGKLNLVFFLQQKAPWEKYLCPVKAVQYVKRVDVFSQSEGNVASEKVAYMR